MLDGNSPYGSTRDPTLNTGPNSGNDTRTVLTGALKMEAKGSDIEVENKPSVAYETIPDAPDAQHEDARAVKQQNIELIAQIAAHSKETANLQREKATLANELSKESDRFRIMTEAHATMTASHNKRVNKKNKLVAENSTYEDENAVLRGQIAGYWVTRSDNEAKILRLEQQNEKLLGRVTCLEKENRTLNEMAGATKEQTQRLQAREQQLQTERDLLLDRLKTVNDLQKQLQTVSVKEPWLDSSQDKAQGRDAVQATSSQRFKGGSSGPRKHPRQNSFSSERSYRYDREDLRRNFRSDGHPQTESWAPSGPRGYRRR